ASFESTQTNLAQVCSLFNVRDLRSFYELCTAVRAAFLTSFWEHYRWNAFQCYSIEPCAVPTISTLCFQTFLFHSKCEIDFCRDLDMIKMIEENVRGGICYSAKTVTTANNEWNWMNGGFNPSNPRSFIVGFDIASMYPHAMKSF